MPFKEGDVVRCVQDVPPLVVGQEYTVIGRDPTDSEFVMVEGACRRSGGGFFDHRFVLVSPSTNGAGYNAPGQGIKHDTGKLQWSLVPMQYLRGMVRVLMVGAKKYSPNNWRSGMPWSQPYNALHRHLDAWQAGEDLDPETGENHLDHALCELMFLRGFVQEFPKLDDRYKAGA